MGFYGHVMRCVGGRGGREVTEISGGGKNR